MSEEIEIETKELQETIEELHEERREREQEARLMAWTRYIALTTAVLAVFAAIGALQSGALINESMMLQLRASDKWNEYQAARQKDHLYSLQAYALLDRGVKAPAPEAADRRGKGAEPRTGQAGGDHRRSTGEAPHTQEGEKRLWESMPPGARLLQYIGQARKESDKEKALQETAQELERESREKAHLHHQFARSVALIQVAISLSAVAALTRMKSIWWLSMLVGAIGLVLFAAGTVGPR
jgi:hypothetical protein